MGRGLTMPLPRLRFTVRWMMIVVAAAALAVASYVWVVRPPYKRLEPAPQPALVSTDHDIFDIVLTDLIDNQDFDPAVGGRGVPKSEIVFADTTAPGFKDPFGLNFFCHDM